MSFLVPMASRSQKIMKDFKGEESFTSPNKELLIINVLGDLQSFVIGKAPSEKFSRLSIEAKLKRTLTIRKTFRYYLEEKFSINIYQAFQKIWNLSELHLLEKF